ADVEDRAAGAHDARAGESADAPRAADEERTTDRRPDAARDADRHAPAGRAAGDHHPAEAGADPGDGSPRRAAATRSCDGGGRRAGVRVVRARDRGARHRGDPARVSGADVGSAARLRAVLRGGAQARRHLPRRERRRLGDDHGRARERDVRVRELIGAGRAAAGELRGAAPSRWEYLEAGVSEVMREWGNEEWPRDASALRGHSSFPHSHNQNVRSSPTVYARFGRRPPRLRGKSALSTMIVLRAGATFTPNEPSTMSSRVVGMFVGLRERRKGASHVTTPGSTSLLSPTWSAETRSAASVTLELRS